MGSDEIAEIEQAVRQVLGAGPDWCATFELAGDADKWVQFKGKTINAAYPFPEISDVHLARYPEWRIAEFEPMTFVTGIVELNDAPSIARLIDSYFVNVLGCDEAYALDVMLDQL